ncbi:TPM domain-containing protein [Patescibacteria group bacterium]|nr:TPM domain-containing protein [Patescibacteria group bacterium]
MFRALRLGWISAIILLGTLGLVCPIAKAYTSPGSPNGYVNDFANILSPEEETELSRKVHEQKLLTSNQIAIVTVSSTAPESIETYAVELFEEWGIGREAYDNGALLLLAVNDRKLRIEVGYGLEGLLTDAQSARIIARAVPLLKEQKYPTAIEQMTDDMLLALKGSPLLPTEDSSEAAITEKTAYQKQAAREEWIFMIAFLLFIFSLILIPMILAVLSAKKRGTWQSGSWNSGGFSGDSSSSNSSSSSSSSSGSSSSGSSHDSFGGGSSGGGGASGSW